MTSKLSFKKLGSRCYISDEVVIDDTFHDAREKYRVISLRDGMWMYQEFKYDQAIKRQSYVLGTVASTTAKVMILFITKKELGEEMTDKDLEIFGIRHI